MRVKLMKALCALLRHPDERTVYSNGRALTRCPCGFIEVYDRAFPTSSTSSG